MPAHTSLPLLFVDNVSGIMFFYRLICFVAAALLFVSSVLGAVTVSLDAASVRGFCSVGATFDHPGGLPMICLFKVLHAPSLPIGTTYWFGSG